MNDRELLELAAKAAGVEGGWGERVMIGGDEVDLTDIWFLDSPDTCAIWNPLEDDGDALRLAVELKLSLLQHPDGMDVTVVFPPATGCRPLAEQQTLDREEGLRRAIVRAAAEIGKTMP